MYPSFVCSLLTASVVALPFACTWVRPHSHSCLGVTTSGDCKRTRLQPGQLKSPRHVNTHAHFQVQHHLLPASVRGQLSAAPINGWQYGSILRVCAVRVSGVDSRVAFVRMYHVRLDPKTELPCVAVSGAGLRCTVWALPWLSGVGLPASVWWDTCSGQSCSVLRLARTAAAPLASA
jgi:hypothetical protein